MTSLTRCLEMRWNDFSCTGLRADLSPSFRRELHCVCVCVCVCTHMYVHVHVHVHVSACALINVHTCSWKIWYKVRLTAKINREFNQKLEYKKQTYYILSSYTSMHLHVHAGFNPGGAQGGKCPPPPRIPVASPSIWHHYQTYHKCKYCYIPLLPVPPQLSTIINFAPSRTYV